MLYCRTHKCARNNSCERYKRGKRFNFQNDDGLWYVNEYTEDNCLPETYKLYIKKNQI